MSRPALEEELTTLARYTQHDSTTLELGEVGRWEALWSDQHRAEKQQMKERIYDLKLQRNKYLQEIKKVAISLTWGEECFASPKSRCSLFDQVTHLVKIVEKRTQTLTSIWGILTSAQKEFESLCPYNPSLTQQLTDYMNATLEVVLQSFEISLR